MTHPDLSLMRQKWVNRDSPHLPKNGKKGLSPILKEVKK